MTDREHNPLLVVEFDGPWHKSEEQKKRDGLKDGLFARFNLPLLRVNGRYLPTSYRGMDLLSWLVEVWFLDRAFADAQERGELPWDEDFDPIFVVAMAGRNGSFPLWLSAPVQTGIEKLHKRGAHADAVPSHVIGRDGARAYRASLSANMSETVNTRSRTALRL